MVVKGDDIQNQVCDIGSRGTKQGLRASRAILEMQPDHRWALSLADRLGYLKDGTFLGERQAHRCGYHESRAEL